jgi:glycosyltransferase involved in cell wall biosynthesis
MKILYLITKAEMGGAQTHVLDLAKNYKIAGHDIAIMSSCDGWLAQKSQVLKINYYLNKYFVNSFNPILMLWASQELDKCLKDFKPDVVHCHSSFAGIVGRLTIKNKIPTFFTAHGWSFNEGVGPIQKFLGIISERVCAKYCTKVICCAEFVKDLALKYKIAKPDKFEIIYNGIVSREVDYSKKDNGIAKIVMVARLAEPKNPFLLIDAYSKLSDKAKEKSQIIIIGDGPQTKTLRDLVRDINLFEKVKFTGAIDHDDVFEYLENGHIFALPSKWEGFPYTIIEGMNAKMAVIASDVGGIKEAVNKNCGILIKGDNPDDWKDNLEYLINNPELVRKMGEFGSIEVKEKFDIKIMFEKVFNLYTNK